MYTYESKIINHLKSLQVKPSNKKGNKKVSTKTKTSKGTAIIGLGLLSVCKLSNQTVAIGSKPKGNITHLTPLQSPIAALGAHMRSKGYVLKPQHSYEQTLIIASPSSGKHVVTLFSAKRTRGFRVCINTIGCKRETWRNHYDAIKSIMGYDDQMFKAMSGDTGYFDIAFEALNVDKFEKLFNYAESLVKTQNRQPHNDTV